MAGDENRNTAVYGIRNGVTDDEKSHVGSIQDAVGKVQADFGKCEHGKPLLFGNCEECRAERKRMRRERLLRATTARATAEVCGNCGEGMNTQDPVVLRRVFSGTGHTLAPTCAECAKLSTTEDCQPCYWCERPVLMSYDTYSSRRRSGIFCCDECRAKWHNRRNSAIRKEERRRFLEKTCVVCAKEFTATRSDQKTCSPACRQKAYRDRNKVVG